MRWQITFMKNYLELNRPMSKYIRQTRQEIIQRHIEKFKDFQKIDFEKEDEGVMEREEILRTLISCGLSEYESRTYSSLVFLGPSKAGTISKESKVPQSKIYEVLDQLMNKQLVEVFDGRPKEFKAAEPEIALKNLLDEQRREIETLKSRVEAMSNFLKPVKKGEVLSGIWTIKGEKFKEFFNKTAEMLNRSKKYVYAITRDFSRSASMSESVRKCVKRGIKVRVIGMEKINENNYYKALWYKEQGLDLKFFETKVHPRIIVVDGREILLRLDYNPQKRNRFRFNSLWSEDVSLVSVIDNYVKNMWKSAKPINFRRIPTPI